MTRWDGRDKFKKYGWNCLGCLDEIFPGRYSEHTTPGFSKPYYEMPCDAYLPIPKLSRLMMR